MNRTSARSRTGTPTRTDRLGEQILTARRVCSEGGTMTGVDPGDQLREMAIKRLRNKRGLQAHVLAYATVNLFLVALWYFTAHGGFFWPMFPIFGWGIGLVFHVWDVFSPEIFSEDQVQREMGRLRQRSDRVGAGQG
jgi:hypothetical protein